jgi:hypothetical protein
MTLNLNTILKWFKLWDYKLPHRSPLEWHHLHTFHENLPIGSKVAGGDTDTQTVDLTSFLSFLESGLMKTSIRHAWPNEHTAGPRRKRWKVLTVATLVQRNANDVMVAPGEVCVGGTLKSGGRFCIGALASVAGNMFPHLIYFIHKRYKCCSFSAICKDNGTLHSTAVKHKFHYRQI